MSDQTPLVSVCVPTHSRAALLARCLATVRAQTYPRLEILIGDNASTDETPALCQRLVQEDARVRVWRNDAVVCNYANHNALAARARGRYLVYCHDDDEFEPTMVAEEVAFLEAHPEAGIVSPDWRLIDEHGTMLGARDHQVPALQPGLAYIEQTLRSGQSCLGLSGTMVRRSVLEGLVFDEQGPVGFGDFVLWFEVAERSAVGHIPKRLYAYRLHTQALSRRSILSISEDYRRSLQTYCDRYLRRHPQEQARVAAWRGYIDRYLFWMLAYEIGLFHANLPPWEADTVGRRYRTVFELMHYRLTAQELEAVWSAIGALRLSRGLRGVRWTMRQMETQGWTWPLARLVPHAPTLRTLVRLK